VGFVDSVHGRFVHRGLRVSNTVCIIINSSPTNRYFSIYFNHERQGQPERQGHGITFFFKDQYLILPNNE